MTYEPNPPPDQVEAFQPFGGKPLALLRVGAGLLARKGQAEPILEPSPEKRAALEARAAKDAPAQENRPQADEAPSIDAPAPRPGLVEAQAGAIATPRPGAADSSFEEPIEAAAGRPAADARPVQAGAALEPRASLSFEVTAAEFLRLSIAAAQLGKPAQQILAAALEAYLDAKGVKRPAACACVAGVRAQFSMN